MGLESSQPVVKKGTTNIPGGKGGRCVRLTTSMSWKSGSLNHTGPVPGLLYLFLRTLIKLVVSIMTWKYSLLWTANTEPVLVILHVG